MSADSRFDLCRLEDVSLYGSRNQPGGVEPDRLMECLVEQGEVLVHYGESGEATPLRSLTEASLLLSASRINVRLSDVIDDVVLLYITNESVVMHIPESHFVTGDRTHDHARLLNLRNLAACVSTSLNFSWSFLEFEGETYPIEDLDQAWDFYASHLKDRVGYGPRDD